MVTQPTRTTATSSNVLDLLLTSAPDFVSEVKYLPGLSDHCLLHITLNLPSNKTPNKTKTIYNYAKANFSSINDGLRFFLDDFVLAFAERSVNDNWCMFKEKLHELIELHVPRKIITTNRRSPWFTRSLKRLGNRKRRLYVRARSSGRSEHWSALRAAVGTYKKSLKDAKQHFFNVTLPSFLLTDTKKFWNVVNGSDQPSISLLDSQSNPIPNSDSANVLNETFANAFSVPFSASPPDYTPAIIFPMDPIRFDFEGIISIIDRLKLSSSCGPDNISTKILKNTKVYSSIILSKIFEQSLQTCDLPDDWKLAKVVPLHKSGDKHLSLNYRPVSLTSIPCKVMEHVILSSLANFLESSSFFTHAQHGFRKHFSCETQLINFTNDINFILDRGSEVDCIYLDFSKAFDKVSHSLLLHKLSKLNIDQNVLRWIECFLSNRFQYVHANGINSSPVSVTSGVPQGSVIGPLLFLVYINDLPNNVTSTVRLFADDCVVYREIKNTNDTVLLQEDLATISNWCSQWKMTLNDTKCKVMRFSRRVNPCPAPYTICSSLLTPVTSYKYLGVIITSNLAWKAHIISIIASANRMLGYLKRNFSLAPTPVKLLLYKSLVRSKLEYANSVWDPFTNSLIDALEAVQNRAARFILRNYDRLSSVTEMKNTLSLTPLATRRKISRLCLFFKIYHMNCSLKDTLLTPPTYVSSRLDHPCKVGVSQCRTTSCRNSFIPKTSLDWNQLPWDIALSKDFDEFKKKLSTHYCLP